MTDEPLIDQEKAIQQAPVIIRHTEEEVAHKKNIRKRLLGIMELTKRDFGWNNPGEVDFREMKASIILLKKWFKMR